jgi:hypothetical protein
MDWQPIETAPKDGTVFIARNADHPSFGSWPMVRNVRWTYSDGITDFVCADLGAWLRVLSIEPDYEEGHSVGGCGVPYSIAPDDLNTSVRYEWMPLPMPQSKVQDPSK